MKVELRSIGIEEGNPVDAVVAPGTAMVMCTRAFSLLGPMLWYQTEPYSGFTRVPSFSAASNAVEYGNRSADH